MVTVTKIANKETKTRSSLLSFWKKIHFLVALFKLGMLSSGLNSADAFQHNVNKAKKNLLYAFPFPLVTLGIKQLQRARILTTCYVLFLPVRNDDSEGSFGSANFQVQGTIQGWEKSVKDNPVK